MKGKNNKKKTKCKCNCVRQYLKKNAIPSMMFDSLDINFMFIIK